MENLSAEQSREQGQQASAQLAHIRPPPTAAQLAEFAASNQQNRQKREAPEPFDVEVEAPARRTQAPQSTGIHNQRFLPSSPAISEQKVPTITPVDQSHPVVLAPSASNQGLPTSDAHPSDQDHIQPVTSAFSTNTDLRKQLRDEIRKEMELLFDSRLAKRTLEVETVWRGKREERTKAVENYWKQKLAEAVSNGRDDKTRELHEEIEKLKTRLDKGPGLIKAAEERGKRQGELDGFNKLSLNPELKPSQDRLNFDFLMKEKDKELAEVKTTRDSWFRDARKYSEETNAKLLEKDQEIQRLQAQVQSPPPQQPLAPDNIEALVAEGRELQGRFTNQTQELVSLQQMYNQQANDLANLTARLDHELQELSNREQQLSAQSAELSAISEELNNQTKAVLSLRRESDRKSVDLNDSNAELEKNSGEIKNLREEHHQDLEKLETYKQQAEAQSKEIASLQARHDVSESSNQEKDGKIASLRELLDNSGLPQSNSSDQEEIKLLKRRLAESESLLDAARSENSSLRDHHARNGLLDIPANSEGGNAEADADLVRTMLEKEREKNEAENSRRESRVDATLEGLEGTERERRQLLIDELESKDTELYDAQKRIKELEQQLLASSSLQSSQASTSPLNNLPPSQVLPTPTHPSPPIIPTSPAAGSSSWLQRSRFPGPRSLFIVIFIFLLTFFVPYLQSLANSGSEYELVGPASRSDRLRWEAWELSNRERNEGVPTYEESWRRTQEVGQMGGWDP